MKISLFFSLFLLVLFSGCATIQGPEMMAEVKSLNKEGVQLINQGMWPEARDIFSKALKINPDDAAAHNNLGFCYQNKGKIKEAIGEYEKAIELSQNITILRQAHMNLAHIYMDSSITPPVRQPDWPSKLIAHLNVLIEYEPDLSSLHMWLGFTYFNVTNPGGGFEALRKASELALSRDDIWIHERIRDFYAQINMVDEVEAEQDIIDELKLQVDD